MSILINYNCKLDGTSGISLNEMPQRLVQFISLGSYKIYMTCSSKLNVMLTMTEKKRTMRWGWIAGEESKQNGPFHFLTKYCTNEEIPSGSRPLPLVTESGYHKAADIPDTKQPKDG